mmetsp:Transcript_19528/g.21180  ORF Transcript_19528/g.21180 Transcript_19528/m.21180 type:complete len:410 (+) Transcript_19528:44-1273(+)|eukprot:CAMPEP_0173149524 /NCGR_PEP_ID=MMETSP1105-20130129/10378_1 /TAXON_ID=2985 /ORGANISM="Ochromonas sp., Strain BG-1" /LENGTH=409 /DNA_ID=CAMNT_0014064409 /DNA_START=44 /DNA_END=1273 /DNA_ORIENTATION=+
MKVLLGFGLNEDGQCGGSVKKDREVGLPQIIKFATRVQIIGISAGSRHSLALSAEGHVYSWGWGLAGQLGHGDNINLSHPLRIPSLTDITCISAGGMHSGCISATQTCYMWGDNSQGQLGIGKTAKSAFDEPTPIIFEDQKPFQVTRLSCGGMHSAAISIDGDVYCWGKSDSGQTGFSHWYLEFSTNIYWPRKVEELEHGIDVSCGGFYTLVLTATGQVFAMGKEDYGCLGTGAEETAHDTSTEGPSEVHTLTDSSIKQISAGGWHSCFLTEDGKLYASGKGEYGRLGLGEESSKLFPTKVQHDSQKKTLCEIQQVSAGGSHTIWFDRNNHIYTVGRTDGGRCGNGSTSTGRLTLAEDITKFFPLHDFTVLEVAAGGSHTLALVESPQPLDDHSVIYASSPCFKNVRSL